MMIHIFTNTRVSLMFDNWKPFKDTDSLIVNNWETPKLRGYNEGLDQIFIKVTLPKLKPNSKKLYFMKILQMILFKMI